MTGTPGVATDARPGPADGSSAAEHAQPARPAETAPPAATTLRLGTRRSALATTQSTWVAQRLRDLGQPVELVEITTAGDTSTEPLTAIGGTGVFAAAIRRALLAGEIDLAVHSLKDLPTAARARARRRGRPRVREDVRDALVARDGLTLGELPAGSVVGTGSPRRAAQLRALGLGLDVQAVRGNVDTRIAARALRTLRRRRPRPRRAGAARPAGRGHRDDRPAADAARPRPGRARGRVPQRPPRGGRPGRPARRPRHPRRGHAPSAPCSAALEAGCTAPVGALAEVVEGDEGVEISLRAFVGSEDGSVELRRSARRAARRPRRSRSPARRGSCSRTAPRSSPPPPPPRTALRLQPALAATRRRPTTRAAGRHAVRWRPPRRPPEHHPTPPEQAQ